MDKPRSVVSSGDKWEMRVLQKLHCGKFLPFNLQSGSISGMSSHISLEMWNFWVTLVTHTQDTKVFAALPKAHKPADGGEAAKEYGG